MLAIRGDEELDTLIKVSASSSCRGGRTIAQREALQGWAHH